MTRDELIEAGTRAVCDWDPDYDPADEDTRAAVGVVIDAVEGKIRADERERLAPVFASASAIRAMADLRASADLHAQVTGMGVMSDADHDYADGYEAAKRDFLDLLENGGSNDGA